MVWSSFVIVVTGLLSTSALAQSTTSAQSSALPPTPTTVTSAATVVPSTALYTYIGCYNETTEDDAAGNVRALSGGNMTRSPGMDVNFCLNFCGANTYAGLEYSDECWCAPYLNVDSQQLPDANCSLPCAGDGTEICGGSLKLTLYQHKNGTSSEASTMRTSLVTYGAIGLGLLGLAFL